MLNKLKNLLGFGEKTDFALLKKAGAIILDVRSVNEFSYGHIPGSINIPVDQLNINLNKLNDKNKVIITCCASGVRSAKARNFLFVKGYQSVYNGGSWKSLKDKIQ